MLKTSLLLPALLVPALAAAGAAQMPEGPAKELARYDRLLGDFEGSGQVFHAPDAPPGQWTSVTSCTKVLGGHFLREDTSIDLGAEVPTPLQFTTFYGFDRETKSYRSYSMTNMGEVSTAEIHFIGDKMVWTGASMFQGQPKIERWQVQFGDRGYTMIGEEAVGDSAFFTHVTGTFKKATGAEKAELADAAFVQGNGPATMKGFARMAGSYRLEGQMIPAAGAPEMAIAGDSELRLIFGGSVLEMTVKGDPIPGMGSYEGIGGIAYDANAQCHTSFWVDNFGDASVAEGRWLDGSFVSTAERLMQGEPMLQRTIMICDESGKLVGEKGHNLTGTHDPVVNFSAKYTPK